ncbi:protein phosphatase 2C domain-containing protein [Actinoplanes sp. NPDC049265]|uniref:protein phosphatase 2C domain-containing protein n=1 Tax=Actinoplanes sp. NPDC049265 TaxID=3363902 RepID=UPI003723EEA5
MTTIACAACDDERAAGATFCEACGRRLITCAHCGGGVGDDGYCESCGMMAERENDHAEHDAGPLGAAVTDRGRRHHRNEDAMFLTDGHIVVCDGVSASARADEASSTAASVAGQSLAAGLSPVDALLKAGEAVSALGTDHDSPACTIVAASVHGSTVTWAWVGDSRAYWVPAEGPAERLTEDDSWARHAVDLGADPETAMLSPQAHAITAWLGADAPAVRPSAVDREFDSPGTLVLCTDGLWNYLPDPADFADAVRGNLEQGPLAAARALVGLANERGGADNITVALTPVGGPRGVHR